MQAELPEHVMYLQPYSSRPIVKLKVSLPTPESPVRLYLSTTEDFASVRYEAEVIGWEDKTDLPPARHAALKHVIKALQPGEEGGLYDAAKGGDGKSVNLLHIRRLRKLTEPFRVSRLIKISDGEPMSENRTTAGGYSYVTLAAQP